MVRLESLRIVVVDTFQEYFNSSMVRLESYWEASSTATQLNFNSSMVRLEFNEGFGTL